MTVPMVVPKPCAGYDPPITLQLDGSPFAGYNCGPSACSCAIADTTCGAKHPTARRVRELSGDRKGGMNLGQLAIVAREHYGVRLDVRYRMPWAEYEVQRRKGRGAIIAVCYAPIRDSSFRGSTTFADGHALYDTPSSRVRDSLADGRRAGIYRFANAIYPRALIRKAAGMLDVGPPLITVRLGDGLINAAFTVDNDPSGWRVHVGVGPLDWWRLVDGKAQRYIVAAQAKGFSPRCTAPAFYMWPKHGPVSLVRVLEGGGKGRYIAATAPRVRVEAIP